MRASRARYLRRRITKKITMTMMMSTTRDPPVSRLSLPELPSSSHAARNVIRGSNAVHMRLVMLHLRVVGSGYVSDLVKTSIYPGHTGVSTTSHRVGLDDGGSSGCGRCLARR